MDEKALSELARNTALQVIGDDAVQNYDEAMLVLSHALLLVSRFNHIPDKHMIEALSRLARDNPQMRGPLNA